MAPRERHLYLVRHAVAEPRGAAWPDDDVRPLSAEGAARFRRIAASLVTLGVEFDLVLASPLRRTWQTAELLAAAFPSPVQPVHIEACDELRPGGSLKSVLALIDSQLAVRRHDVPVNHVAIVGHEPGIGLLAARLIGLAGALPFKKGAVARIDIEGSSAKGRGTLRWFLPPRVIERLATGAPRKQKKA